MSSKKRFAARFFLTYLCVWLPLLMINIVQTHTAWENLVAREEKVISSQLLLICNELDDLYRSYYGNSITLAQAPELLPSRVMNSYLSAFYAIRYLQSATLYDIYAYDTCLYYGDGKIYSAQGYASLSTYLSKSLGLRNAQDMAAVFDSPRVAVACAWKGEDNGYLLLHCPIQGNLASAAVSVNSFIPFSGLKRILGRLSGPNPNYINLRFSDGNVVHYDGADQLALVSQSQYAADAQTTDYTVLRRRVASLGLDVEVLYDPEQFYAEVNRLQIDSTLLIALGVVVSTLVSVYLSQHRIRKIRFLEGLVDSAHLPGPDAASRARPGDEYAHIGSILRNAQQESSNLRSNQQLYRRLLKQQTLRLIFHSFFQDRAEVNQVLALGGIELYEEHYFVCGVLLAMDAAFPDALRARFASELCCDGEVRGRPAFFLLLELPNADLPRELRARTMEEICAILRQGGLEEASVAASQAYQNIYMASYAYQEVVGLLEQAPDKAGFSVHFWEGPDASERGVLCLDQDALDEFLSAVEERDPMAAEQALHGLNRQVAARSDTEEGRRYLRYCILQPLVQLIQTSLPDANSALLEGALALNPSDGASFEENINRLLRRHLSEDARTHHFQRILDYIEEHYADCNLTADRVADYGGFSKAYLSRLFKARTRLSYIDYLTCVRMNKAKTLLRETDLSIREIVTKVGYIDDSSFRRKFKALYGLSVAEYRNGQEGP